MIAQHTYLDNLPVVGTQLWLTESATGCSESDSRNINFVPESHAVTLSFSSFSGHELSLHGASMEGALEDA